MAAEPKRSFKRTVASTVEGRSPGFLLSSLAIAMVISILAGLGIGYAIGKDNKKTGKPTAAVSHTSTTRRGTKAAAIARKVPIKGVVVRAAPKLLVVNVGKRKVSLALVPKSIIKLAQTGTAADIKAGSHVLLVFEKPPAGTAATGTAAAEPKAAEILIVSGTKPGRLGNLVTATTPDSLSFKTNGKTITVSTTGARVTKTVPGKRANLTAGAHVLIKKFVPPPPKKKAKKGSVKRRVIAVEIVIVPATSKFA